MEQQVQPLEDILLAVVVLVMEQEVLQVVELEVVEMVAHKVL